MKISLLFFLAGALLVQEARAQELYELPANVSTGWASFENPNARPGQGGQANKSAKGHAFDSVPAGGSVTLLDVQGAGTVRRIWLTVNDRSPRMLRSLRLDAYWDGAKTPAVSTPLGDFFGIALGRKTAFQNALFSDPEGRSFNCIIPMPFRKSARIVLTNESDQPLDMLFYDVNFTRGLPPANALYFHAHWNRTPKTGLGTDFEILPKVVGKGRFLGSNLGVQANPAYGETWWGEGEVKLYVDGDGAHPTLVGTGTEDYIGTAWGQGAFAQQFQGSPVADAKKRQWCFYRYHVPDPVYFAKALRVTIQAIGGGPRDIVRKLADGGAALRPVSVDRGKGQFVRLFELPKTPNLTDADFPEGWVNFFRQDDYCATAYFYLDRPENGLPPLMPVAGRTANLNE